MRTNIYLTKRKGSPMNGTDWGPNVEAKSYQGAQESLDKAGLSAFEPCGILQDKVPHTPWDGIPTPPFIDKTLN